MFDRARVCLVLIVSTVATGCDPHDAVPDTFGATARAIAAKERAGDFDAAVREWQQLASTATSNEVRATAELGLARCAAALNDRDHARTLLEGLPARVGTNSLAVLDSIAAEQAARFVGGPFETEFRELRNRVGDLCRARSSALRNEQLAAVRATLERGEFCAALDALQLIERSREPDDREDVAKLVAETNAAAEIAADAVLVASAETAKTDPAAALQQLDAAYTRFQGSNGAPKIAEARAECVEIARKAAAVVADKPGKSAADHDKRP